MPLAMLRESRARGFPCAAPPCAKEAVVTQNRCGALTHRPRTTCHYTPITYGTTYIVFCHEVRLEVKEAMPHPINLAACTQNLSPCICYMRRPYTCCPPSPRAPALASSASAKRKKKKKGNKKIKKQGQSLGALAKKKENKIKKSQQNACANN